MVFQVSLDCSFIPYPYHTATTFFLKLFDVCSNLPLPHHDLTGQQLDRNKFAALPLKDRLMMGPIAVAMPTQGHPGRPGGIPGAGQTGLGGLGGSLRDRLPVGVADASARPSFQRGHSAPGGLGLGPGPGPGGLNFPTQPQHYQQQQQNYDINTHQQFASRGGGRMQKHTHGGGTSSTGYPQGRGIPHVNSSPSLSTLVDFDHSGGMTGGGGEFSGRRKSGTSLHMSSPDLFSLFQGQKNISHTH